MNKDTRNSSSGICRCRDIRNQEDPLWRDYVWFYEYFHGDNGAGAGLGASHQTGWTAIIARAMHLFSTTTAEQVLELGKAAAFMEVVGGQTTGRAL